MTDDHDLVRAEILALGDDVLARAKTRGAMETVDRLDGALRRLRSGKLVVVVCGEHKQGKSRLLNALLDEPDLLTVDSFFATRLVTTIAHGPAEHIEVVFDDGSTKVVGRAPCAAGRHPPAASPAGRRSDLCGHSGDRRRVPRAHRGHDGVPAGRRRGAVRQHAGRTAAAQ
jgi:hypothetical protein